MLEGGLGGKLEFVVDKLNSQSKGGKRIDAGEGKEVKSVVGVTGDGVEEGGGGAEEEARGMAGFGGGRRGMIGADETLGGGGNGITDGGEGEVRGGAEVTTGGAAIEGIGGATRETERDLGYWGRGGK